MKKPPLMKLILLLTLLATLPATAMVEAQTIHIQKKKTTLSQAMKMVQNQSGIPYFLKGREIADLPIDASVSADNLDAAMDQLLGTLPLSWTWHDNTVVITEKPTLINIPVQQQHTLIGLVTNTVGEAISGVTVSLLNSHGQIVTNTATDEQGHYQLLSTSFRADYRLRFTMVGYQPLLRDHIQMVAGRTEIPAVRMHVMSTNLDEVVVTGQGMSVSKRRLSTNVTVISEERLKNIPSQRIDQLLQSQIPNALFKLSGGQSGSTSIIQTRGFNSAFANSTPIIYVDGVRVDNLNTAPNLGMSLSGGISQGASTSALSDLPVDNIERVEFINGGAATTLYGSDAANGVLQIFTKKSGTGNASFSFGADLGTERATTDFHYFDRTEEVLYQPGTYQRYTVGANGRSGTLGYSVSGSYADNTGVMIHNQNENQKLDFRVGLNAQLLDGLTYESSFSYNNQALSRVRNGNSGGYSGLWFVEDGASKIIGGGFNPVLDELNDQDFAVYKAFVDRAEQLQDNTSTVNRFQTSQSLNYRTKSGISFKGVAGVDYRQQRERSAVTLAYNQHIRSNATGSLSNYMRNFLGLTFDLNAQYDYQVGDWSFLTTAGGQLFRTEDRQVAYIGQDIRDGASTISQAATRTSNEYYGEVANYGLFIQENVGFKNRYFLDIGVRGDGNSAFGSSVGIQYYPKVGLSYILSSEPFFADNLQHIIHTLKIRANYGVSGNFPTPFTNERTVSFSGFDGGQSATFGHPGNIHLRPEKMNATEVGIDATILKGRLAITANYFNNITNDALFNVPPATSSGVSSSLRNIGTIENKGFEFAVNASVIARDRIGLDLRASANTLSNMVLSTGGAPAFHLNGLTSRTVQIVVSEGYPVGYITGNYGVFDSDGVLEEIIPMAFLGSTIPTLTGSMGLNFRYHQFNLAINADYQQGGYLHNWDKQFRINYGASTEGVPAAEIEKNGVSNWLDYSHLFVEKSDFLKVRLAAIHYTLQKQHLPKSVQGASIGFSAVNPLNFTASASDPEAVMPGGAQGQGSATTGGINYAAHSAPRQYLLSLKLNF